MFFLGGFILGGVLLCYGVGLMASEHRVGLAKAVGYFLVAAMILYFLSG